MEYMQMPLSEAVGTPLAYFHADGGKLIAFDRDADALGNAPKDARLTLIHNNFRFIENYAEELRRSLDFARDDKEGARDDKEGARDDWEGPAVFDGILADLGVSSHQFDTAGRGFSFRFEEAPLDMRMNRQASLTAEEVVNSYAEADLERILRLYGEVDGSRNMARLIVQARAQAALHTTGDLDRAIARMLPKNAEHKVLAKVYQALRIEVNQEMRALEKFLDGAARSLKPGGRLVVITYHSLEDRMVKNFIKTGNVDGEQRKDAFGRMETPLEAVNRKPVVPEESEIERNTRARSAKLRIAERRSAV